MSTRAYQGNNFPAARMLRRAPTPTETALWKHLRNRQLDGFKFRRQHPVGRFVLDFYCDEVQLALEIDGGIHRDSVRQLADEERQQLLEDRGIRFLRIPAGDVEADLDAVLNRIMAACASTPPPLHASGEGAGG